LSEVFELWASVFRTHLKQYGFADKSRVALRTSDGRVAVPINAHFLEDYSTKNEFCGISFTIDAFCLQKSRWSSNSPKQTLLAHIRSLIERQQLWSKELEDDLPDSWEKHMDMLILPANCFQQQTWMSLGK
jgi:hypothetical protein